MSNEFEKFISENREDFDDRMPDTAVLDRIRAQMNDADKKQGILIPMKAIRCAAAACVILMVGAVLFFMRRENSVVEEAPTAKLIIDTPAVTALQQSTASTVIAPAQKKIIPVNKAVTLQKKNTGVIDEQLALQKQLLVAKLNDMQSPGQRITAAEQAYYLKNSDREIVDVLVKTMNTDPNTNVRLAALEALGKFHRESYVKIQLTNSLKTQKDPIVQIELIQMLTKMKQVSILRELEKIVDDGNTLKAVKDHAYAGILTLTS